MDSWSGINLAMRRSNSTANRVSLTLVLLFALYTIAWLITKPLPPLQDFPVWAYQGWLTAHLLHGPSPSVEPYMLVHYPVPNMFCQALLAGLNWIVGPLAAARLTIALLIGSGFAVCLIAARRFDGPRAGLLALLLVGLAATNTMFWNGFVNFEFSVVILLGYLALRRQTTPWLVAVTGLLLFVCHPSTFAAFVLLVTLEVVLERKSALRIAALLPGLALLAWYIVGRHSAAMQPDSGSDYTGIVHFLSYKAYTITKFGPFHNLVGYGDSSFVQRAHWLYLAGVGLNALFALVLALAVVPAVVRRLREQPRDALLVSATLLFVGSMLLPSIIFNEINLGERFLYATILLAIAGLGSVRLLPALAGLTVCGLALTAGQMATMPVARFTSPLAPAASHSWEGQQAFQRFGLYDSRLYQLDRYRVFLEQPRENALPPLFFDTSLILERHPEVRH